MLENLSGFRAVDLCLCTCSFGLPLPVLMSSCNSVACEFLVLEVVFKCNKKLCWIYSSFCIFMKAFILMGSMQLRVMVLFSFNNERKQKLVCN